MKKASLWAVAAYLLFTAPATAKEGFYLGVFLPNSTLSGNAGTNVDSGAGWGVRAGLGANRYVAIEGHYSVTKHDVTGGPSLELKGLAGDVKLHFPLMSLDSAQVMTLEPYLLFGVSHVEATSSGNTNRSNGAQYGVGLELYLFRELSVNAGWTNTSVPSYTTPEREGDIRTVDFGITYHFI